MKQKISEVISEGYASNNVLIYNISQCSKYIINDVNLEIIKLEHIIKNAYLKLNKDKNEYYEIQKLMLSDITLYNSAKDIISKDHINAEAALEIVLEGIINSLKKSSSTYLQERVYDILDLKNHLLRNDLDIKETDKFILAIEELTPSFLIKYSKNIEGIVSIRGGYTSHGAILARNYEIPYVLVDNFSFKNNDFLILDTKTKILLINEQIDYDHSVIKTNDFKITKPSNIKVLANVFLNDELNKVLSYDFDGIGLYRTEFIFMNQNRALTVEEQISIYKEAILKMNGKTVCFRTFDLGDDKKVSYIKTDKKGYLNYVNNKEIFDDQIKALILSNVNNNLRIMFPMLRFVEEFNCLKNRVISIKRELNDNSEIKYGIMLETKEAYLNIETFKDVDFISIGTNDLTNELYGFKREESKDKFNEYKDDLYHKLVKVVDFTSKQNIYLSICGEIASIPEATRSLLNIGIRNFSVSTANSKILTKTINDYYNK